MSKEIWLFANDFKDRHMIYHWKSFFAMIMNLRLLPKNKAHLVRINWKSFSFLHTKMCRRSGHFRRDRGYHCDKEIKRSLLGPRIAVQLAREWRSIIVNSRPSACVDTRRHRRDLAVVQLGPGWSAPPEHDGLACVAVEWSKLVDCAVARGYTQG